MNTNSTYSIGKDHIVCEDYAVSGMTKDLAYAIVCDGCSASPDVDFGARVVAMSAKEILINHVNSPIAFLREKEVSPELFGELTIKLSSRIFSILPSLHIQALDSTLLVTWVKEKKLTAYIYGDGVLIHRTKAGIATTVHISLTSGAPDYLSYDLDPVRRKSYGEIEDNKKVIAVCIGGKTIQVDAEPLKPYILNTPVEDGDVITVISDGINSFRKADNTPIPWTDLVEEFTGYKTLEGEFVLRRIAAFKRKCLKEGTVHSDDISAASIVI